jgi:MYXO-CTERM domain-containing protein
VGDPQAVGLTPGVSRDDLDLVPARAFRAPAGRLELLRFDQRYRGIPVYGPDGTVRVTLAPGGAIAFDGAIVDGREAWANVGSSASDEVARRSILAHAEARSGLPAEALEVAGLRRVAVPGVKRVGWVGTVRSGIAHVATIVVDADPEAALPLPIVLVERMEAAALHEEVDIGVLAEDPGTDVFTPPDQTAGLGQLFDGSPLRGSMRDTEVILGTERVVGYDVSSAMSHMDMNVIPPLASATPAFAAVPGTVAYDVQNHYVRVQSFYAFSHQYMAGVWESLVAGSSFPAGEFAPRVMLWILPGYDQCELASYCVNYVPLDGMNADLVAVEYQQPVDGPILENLGQITIESAGAPAHVLAHEFGHIVDLFATPYFVDSGLGCTGAADCAPSCQLDTTDEAPVLKEAVAQLFAIAATSALYPVATADNCDVLWDISLGNDGAPHNATCRPNGEPYSHFLAHPCPHGAGLCDHDFTPGVDMGEPTGLCNHSKGYRIDSLHQAFWEIFHAESCADNPPYTCTPMSLPAGLSASDAFMPALLYALRVDSKSIRQLTDAFTTHVSCNLGSTIYEEVNAVLCHHDLRACDAPPPALCEQCGNGVREGAEACDGSDLGGASCESLGLSGGVLGCDASCMLDPSGCDAEDPGLDATGATDPGNDVTGTGTSLGDTTGGAQGDGGSDGCQCSTGSGRGSGLGWTSIGLLGLLAARRRGRTAITALVAVLAGASAQGCCDPGVSTDSSSVGESSSTSDDGSSESTGEMVVPEWAFGIFSSDGDKVGMTIEHPFWYAWGNVEVLANGSVFLDIYTCSEHRERQEFRWTAEDGGRRLNLQAVPPSDVFTFGAGHRISELVIEPGSSCDTIGIRYFRVDPAQWGASEYQRGNVCARTTTPDACTFTFEWCDGHPPAPCE